MSGSFPDAPFGLGQTYYGGTTIDTSNYGGLQHEGLLTEFKTVAVRSAGVLIDLPLRGGGYVLARCVRNVSGIALLPKRLVSYVATTDLDGKRVDGYTTTTAARPAGVIDPWLPATGVPNGDLFWIIEQGDVPVLMPLSNLSADIAVGDVLYAITGATSQCTTSGRITALNSAGTFGDTNTTNGNMTNILLHNIGVALSVKLTSATNADVLCRVKIKQ